MTTICEFEDQEARAEINFSSKIVGESYSILEPASNTVDLDGYDCTAEVEPMSSDYKVSDTVLTIEIDGQKIKLTRM